MMRARTLHIIGAGLSGLTTAAGVARKGEDVIIHEASAHAGGRCRSYFEPALDMMIDNGNHLVLSGNRATMHLLDLVGSRGELMGPEEASFPFVDLDSGEHWTLKPNIGPVPWWVLAKARRVPGSSPFDYLAGGRLAGRKHGTTVGDVISEDHPLYHRMWEPLLVSALNTDPQEACAQMAWAVMRETLARGGQACRPLIAQRGLSRAFIDPVIDFVEGRGVEVKFNHRLKAISFAGERVSELDFGDEKISLDERDAVVLAVPPWVAQDLVPDMTTPTAFRSIVNGHFKTAPAQDQPPILGVVNGAVQWIFAFEQHVSITISAAETFLDRPRQELAEILWADVKAATGLRGDLPAWQIIKEKRATFACTPGEVAKRPPQTTRWKNLVLAGDYVDTSLPATIEGAVRSGFAAARLVRGKTINF